MEIPVALKNQKNEQIVFSDNEIKRIYVDHVTIRQSIFFVILRLLFLEMFCALGLIILYAVAIPRFIALSIPDYEGYILGFFLLLVIIKSGIMTWIVIKWLEEYYDITTEEVIHKRGLIFRKERRITLKHIGAITLQQGILGRLFHYGTIILYDWVNGKMEYMYLIHNPIKYHKILQSIVPEADKGADVLRERFIEPADR